jgi:hypothetical protein
MNKASAMPAGGKIRRNQSTGDNAKLNWQTYWIRIDPQMESMTA